MKDKIQIAEPDPHQQGYVAGREGRSAFSNPYDLHTDIVRNCDWHDGYIEALNDMHFEQVRKEKWQAFWQGVKNTFINVVIAMVLFGVTYIIGTFVRQLIG